MTPKQNLNQLKQKLKKTKRKRKKRKLANNSLEIEILSQGYERVVGIDEVGRGAWAGPVVVGAFVYEIGQKTYKGVRDSKLLSPEERKGLVKKISKFSHQILEGSVESINNIGLGKTIDAQIAAIVRMFDKKTFFLIDGQFTRQFTKRSLKIIKGDMKHYSIACASNLAKEYRDNLMHNLHSDFPHFGFETNVGYPSKYHRDALDVHGPCELHRTSFKPIRQMLEQYSLGIANE